MMMMLVVACVDTIHHLCGVPGNPLVAEQIRSLCLQWSRVSAFSMGWVFTDFKCSKTVSNRTNPNTKRNSCVQKKS